ncbi:MAG: phosphoglycerate dehydrogenase [Clostridia bacterium]
MYNIFTLNKIAKIGIEKLDTDKFACSDSMENPHGILVRSAAMHDYEFGSNLLAIARAGAGVNNIPLDKCSKEGIVVFNTPGANANAVKELVITALLISSRKVVDGVNWAQSLKGNGDAVAKMIEKGKSNYVGPEITGKTLGVIGLGAIGGLVANVAVSLGMNVIGFDPFLSVDSAWNLSTNIKKAKSNREVYEKADYITIHSPLNDDTRNMISKETIEIMKDGVRILNFSRGELVNTADIIKAVTDKKVSVYITDFPNDELLNIDGIIPVPHLGASTPESEDNCAVMAANEIGEYLENGNIINSVNYPETNLPRSTNHRVCIFHNNVPKMLTQISATMAEHNINIENMLNKSKKDVAYTILDVENVPANTVETLMAIDGIYKVRIIG